MRTAEGMPSLDPTRRFPARRYRLTEVQAWLEAGERAIPHDRIGKLEADVAREVLSGQPSRDLGHRFAHNGTFRCPNDWRCDRAQPRMAGSITGAASLCVFSSRFWSRWSRQQEPTTTSRIIRPGCSVSSDATSHTRARSAGKAGRYIAQGLRCRRASSTPSLTAGTSRRTSSLHRATTRSAPERGTRLVGGDSRSIHSRRTSWIRASSHPESGIGVVALGTGQPPPTAATRRPG
jgi:hypothetical protein